MRRRLLTVWYITLLLLLIEIALYSVAIYAVHYYRRAVWVMFNTGANSWCEVNGVPFSAIINQASRSAGLNPIIVAGVIQGESSFQPRALSPAGAYGLMQILPSTWQEVNEEIRACSGRHTGACDSRCYYDPERNIRIGTAYLGKLYRMYQGDMVLALAAYNAGSGTISLYGGVPSYGETTTYIERIITYYYHFRNIPLPNYRLVEEAWLRTVRVVSGMMGITLVFLLWLSGRLYKRFNGWRWQ